MNTSFEHVPFTPYRAGDIHAALRKIADSDQIAVMKVIQGLDAKGKGAHGCFASVAKIAAAAGVPVTKAKNTIHRMHKRGFIAFIGRKGYRQVCRRVVLQPLVAPVQKPEFVMACDILSGIAERPKDINKVVQLEAPELEKIREQAALSLSQSEPVLAHDAGEVEPCKRIDEEIKEIPLREDSFEIISQTSDPSTGSNVEEVETTTPVSHKGRDWLAELAELPCAKLINTRFKCVSGDDAKMLVRLVKNKKVDARVIGYILHHFQHLHTDPGLNEPVRPKTLAAFCKNFFEIQEFVLKESSSEIIASCNFELNRFESNRHAVSQSLRLLEAQGCYKDFEKWSTSPIGDFPHRWCDLIVFSALLGMPGTILLSTVPEAHREEILYDAYHNLDTAKRLCDKLELDLKDTYGRSYDDMAIMAEGHKMWLTAERARLLDPLAWTPTE